MIVNDIEQFNELVDTLTEFILEHGVMAATVALAKATIIVDHEEGGSMQDLDIFKDSEI